jgi:hypothetical protein
MVNPPRALWALLAALLALGLSANGVAMMVRLFSWCGFIPEVGATGPFDEHFVRGRRFERFAGSRRAAAD